MPASTASTNSFSNVSDPRLQGSVGIRPINETVMSMMYHIPLAAQEDIRRTVQSRYGSGFTVENFFQAFELTLNGASQALTQATSRVRELESSAVDRQIQLVESKARIAELEARVLELDKEFTTLKETHVRSEFKIKVFEKMVERFRQDSAHDKGRISELNKQITEAGNDLQKVLKLKAEKDDLVDRLTRKAIFLAREALKGRRLNFLRVLPDLRLLIGRIRFEIAAIQAQLNLEPVETASVTATNGSAASVESTHAVNIASAAGRAMELTDAVVEFLNEYERHTRTILGDISEDGSVTRDLTKHSRGRIPGLDSLMRNIRARVSALVTRMRGLGQPPIIPESEVSFRPRSPTPNGRSTSSASTSTESSMPSLVSVSDTEDSDSSMVITPGSQVTSPRRGGIDPSGYLRFGTMDPTKLVPSSVADIVSPASVSKDWRARQ
ncbi:hypothetical protein V5O48_016032 [Marasmius crinis-equi]|uniref:Uncharacterized protein n=1 Tax=Marasmius crinis-equi TaxID=585013 RepID=A0ABR3ESW0_9AGAR